MDTARADTPAVFAMAPARKGISVLVLLLVAVSAFLVARELIGQARFYGLPAVFSQSALFWLMLAWLGLFIPLGLGSFIYTLRTRLSLSERGVAYRTPWYEVEAPWEQVEAIGAARAGEVALLLRRPAAVAGQRWMARIWHHDRAIPLTPFGQWWGEAPIAEALRSYAPGVQLRRRE